MAHLLVVGNLLSGISNCFFLVLLLFFHSLRNATESQNEHWNPSAESASMILQNFADRNRSKQVSEKFQIHCLHFSALVFHHALKGLNTLSLLKIETSLGTLWVSEIYWFVA